MKKAGSKKEDFLLLAWYWSIWQEKPADKMEELLWQIRQEEKVTRPGRPIV